MEHRIGKQLTQAREALELIVEDIAHRTRIPAAAVRQLESEDYSHFPNNVYAKGFLRIYAKFLGIDPEPYIEEKDGQLVDREDEIAFLEGIAVGPEFQDLEVAKPERKIPNGVLTAATLLVLGIPAALVINKLYAGNDDKDGKAKAGGGAAIVQPVEPEGTAPGQPVGPDGVPPAQPAPRAQPVVTPVGAGSGAAPTAGGNPSESPAAAPAAAPRATLPEAPRATLPDPDPAETTDADADGSETVLPARTLAAEPAEESATPRPARPFQPRE